MWMAINDTTIEVKVCSLCACGNSIEWKSFFDTSQLLSFLSLDGGNGGSGSVYYGHTHTK